MSDASTVPLPTALQIKEDLRKFYPGTKVPLAPFENAPTLTVYPVRFTQIGKYVEQIGSVAQDLDLTKLRIDTDTGKLSSESIAGVMSSLVKIVINKLMPLVDECCVPRVTEIDPYHDVVPEIVGAWIRENFMGERLNPWKRQVEILYEKMTGRQISLSDMLSKLSSVAAIRSTTSSTDGKPASPTTDGPTSSSGSI